jgi:hypothetical protein
MLEDEQWMLQSMNVMVARDAQKVPQVCHSHIDSPQGTLQKGTDIHEQNCNGKSTVSIAYNLAVVISGSRQAANIATTSATLRDVTKMERIGGYRRLTFFP